MSLGNQLLKNGKFAEAQTHFENATQCQPYNDLAHFALGACLAEQRHAKFAVLEFKICAMYSRDDALRARATDEARKNEIILRSPGLQDPILGPRNPATPVVELMEKSCELSERGEGVLSEGHYEEAIPLFKEALRSDKDNVKAKWYLADTRYARCLSEIAVGRHETMFHGYCVRAESAYEYCLGTLPLLLKTEQYGKQSQDLYRQVLKRYSQFLMATWRENRAISLLAAEVKLNPGDQESREQLCGALIRSAEASMKADDYNGAQKNLKSALFFEPGSARAHYQLGLCLKIAGDKNGALKEFSASVNSRGDPQFVQLAKQAIELTQGQN